jgi:FAD/FMN-containing dehydrogenase/Fe-S oxidoreductase
MSLEERLRRDLAGDVRFDDYTRQLYARDASMYAITPLGVAFPKDVDDVVAAVAAAGDHDVPIVPRGAGTSLAGQTVGTGIVLDLSRHMNQILELDPESRTALVEPGVVQDQLNRAAARHGLMFGPDTSTSNRATIGGMIGNNSAGSGSVRYGMTIDHVRELDVVLSDASTARFAPGADMSTVDTLAGRLYRELPKILEDDKDAIATGFPGFWRRAGGYRLDRLADDFDLAKFVVGSEGTLVIATNALVGLVPKPRHTVIAVGHFTSTQAAIAATEDALACDPAAVELMDRTILDLSRQKHEYAALGTILHGDPDALLFVTFSGEDENELAGRMSTLTSLWRKHSHGYHTLEATTPAQQGSLLKVRKAGLGLLMAASVGARRPLAFVEDTAVDPKHLPEYTARFAKILDRHGLRAGFYGHCSVGCLHIRPFVDLTDPAGVATMRAVAEEVKDLVREYGGVNSSEHGDGLARSEFNRELFGADLYEAMRRVKGLFDPANILNPGKIVDAPAMTDNLRDAVLAEATPFTTNLAFEVVGGMRGAADRCMNIGLCRKTDAGVMCPSYMATRNEEDSTRGRANALVHALSQPQPGFALGDDRLHEVLDLCLMCKACKSECPLGVDMAKLKSEAMHHRHEQQGVPLRARIFAGIRTLNKLGSATAPLSNNAGFVRRLIGLAPDRPLPRFQRRNLVRWFRAHRPAGAPRGVVSTEARRGAVTFLADSFTTYTEPAVGQAAIELLTRAGYQVTLAADGCCGRSSLSKGLLDDGRRKVTGLLDQLAGGTTPIVGCEPSCVLSLRDETLSLLPDDPRAREVAGRVRQVEELVTEAIDAGDLPLTSEFAGKKILYHGHCHQKADVGTAATLAMLGRLPGVTVEEVDAGCCGMAGSFGFEKEHYEISMKIGEDRLFPAVRAEPDDTVIAATGVSCRQQISHGTGRRPLHPVEIVLSALKTRNAT